MVFKANHCAQRQQQSMAESVQELTDIGMQEFRNDLQFLDETNTRIKNSDNDKEWRNKEFKKN